MKNTLLCFLFILLVPTISLAGKLKVDQAHSHVGFSVRHLVIATVKGQFNQFQGEVNFDFQTKEIKSLIATVQASSIDTNQKKRDNHLRSPDFFDTNKFPEIKFVSQKILKVGSEYHLTGLLTIKNITRTIQLKGTLLGIVKDDKGRDIIGFQAEGEIDRYDFGLTYNKIMEMGGLSIGKKVKLILDIQLNSI